MQPKANTHTLQGCEVIALAMQHTHTHPGLPPQVQGYFGRLFKSGGYDSDGLAAAPSLDAQPQSKNLEKQEGYVAFGTLVEVSQSVVERLNIEATTQGFYQALGVFGVEGFKVPG